RRQPIVDGTVVTPGADIFDSPSGANDSSVGRSGLPAVESFGCLVSRKTSLDGVLGNPSFRIHGAPSNRRRSGEISYLHFVKTASIPMVPYVTTMNFHDISNVHVQVRNWRYEISPLRRRNTSFASKRRNRLRNSFYRSKNTISRLGAKVVQFTTYR
ncbi:unnamed protein product, partial [Nesidiocoris tenuis]